MKCQVRKDQLAVWRPLLPQSLPVCPRPPTFTFTLGKSWRLLLVFLRWKYCTKSETKMSLHATNEKEAISVLFSPKSQRVAVYSLPSINLNKISSRLLLDYSWTLSVIAYHYHHHYHCYHNRHHHKNDNDLDATVRAAVPWTVPFTKPLFSAQATWILKGVMQQLTESWRQEKSLPTPPEWT